MNQELTTWLAGHHLHYGMSTYWQSSVVSLTTGERVMVVPVSTATKTAGSLVRRDEWESTEDWYDPRLHSANFVVQLVKPNGLPAFLPLASVATRRSAGRADLPRRALPHPGLAPEPAPRTRLTEPGTRRWPHPHAPRVSHRPGPPRVR